MKEQKRIESGKAVMRRKTPSTVRRHVRRPLKDQWMGGSTAGDFDVVYTASTPFTMNQAEIDLKATYTSE